MDNAPKTAKHKKDTDMFGAPIKQVRERWGRKSYAKTKENQDFVALLVASGFDQDSIAETIGCSPKTLRKHFSRELADGARKVKVEMIQVLYGNAKNGNPASAGKLIKMIDDRIFNTVPSRSRKKYTEQKAKKLGSKEQTLADAEKVPDDWQGLLPN